MPWMLAIAAAGAFVGLFVLWVIVPRKLLKDRQGRQPRGTTITEEQDGESSGGSASSAPCGA